MGYVDKQIAAARKTLGDAAAGKGLLQAIRALQEKSKVYDSLKALPARGAITANRKTAKRTGTDASGIASPLTEEAGTRTFHETERELVSSDGLFSLSYFNVQQITMRDAGNRQVVFIYDDYTAT